MTITGYVFFDDDYSTPQPNSITTTATTEIPNNPPQSWYAVDIKNITDEEHKMEVTVKVLPKYRLYITGELSVDQSTRPNWWVRLWCKLLMGFRWEKCEH